MKIGEMDFASAGLLLALITIFYGSFAGDITNSFWLAPLLTVLIFFACWLLVRPQKYSRGDLIVYLGTVIIILSITFLGKLDFNYALYFFGYLAIALISSFFTYFGLKHIRRIRKTNLKSLEKLRRPMILFLILACLVCFLYFNNVIWNWGSEEGEISIKAFQTFLQGVSPYSKIYPMEYGWAQGTATPYSYFPTTLFYYGLFSVLPTSPISAVPHFSNLKAGTMIVTMFAAILLLKTFKELGHESFGRFLSILYILVFGFAWGGSDYIHTLAGFFIILTTYFLATGKNKLSLATTGFTALTQPIGTLFAIFVIVHIIRKTKSKILNWKNMVALAPSAIILTIFFFWDWPSFLNSVFGWWTGTHGSIAGTYYGSTSVANLTYFLSPVIEAIGAKTFFIIKMVLMVLLAMVLFSRYTQTITKTLFAAALFIFTWLFCVNSWISVMYLQEAIVTSFLLIGFLVIKSQASSKPTQTTP